MYIQTRYIYHKHFVLVNGGARCSLIHESRFKRLASWEEIAQYAYSRNEKYLCFKNHVWGNGRKNLRVVGFVVVLFLTPSEVILHSFFLEFFCSREDLVFPNTCLLSHARHGLVIIFFRLAMNHGKHIVGP